MLPDVEGEDGAEALGEGVAGAGLLGDGEGAVGGGGEPDPAGAEEPDALGDKVVLEGIEGAPLFYDLLHEFAGLVRGSRAGGELREVHVVVEDLAGVVEDGAVRLLDDLVQREAFPGGAGEELVQVVDVGLEVLAVMEADGTGADHGLQRIVRIGEVDKCEHGREFKWLRLCSPCGKARPGRPYKGSFPLKYKYINYLLLNKRKASPALLEPETPYNLDNYSTSTELAEPGVGRPLSRKSLQSMSVSAPSGKRTRLR